MIISDDKHTNQAMNNQSTMLKNSVTGSKNQPYEIQTQHIFLS